ncbi:PH domain-containing protein [Corynebacterium hesseae]|uniref:PH domain-containing protein n=1 Tax=Corynebacterium hesseae TaxID=2913502 RepID=UPI00373FB39E
MALEQFSGWTFYSPCEIPSDIPSVLAANEKPICAFKTVRDAAVFTSHRLIIRDSQGLTGKKVEIYSLPSPRRIAWGELTKGHRHRE